MVVTRRLLALILYGLLAVLLGADTLTLAQIDTSKLLLNQLVRVYLGVLDSRGEPVENLRAESFSLYESADGTAFTRIPQLESFQARAGSSEGVNFLLLIDNSGSMYDTLGGRTTDREERRRITLAKQAVRSFVADMTHPQDTVGLVSYNTLYRLHTPITAEKSRLAGLLEEIQRPDAEQAYTELYASITLAAGEFSGIQGRKAMVVLSDGENYPYARYAGKEHPEFKDKLFQPGEAVRTCQEEGISVYAINFGPERDPELAGIARSTGGAVFEAANREELKRVYASIHRQVAGEYLLSYRATMDPGDKKYLRVELRRGGDTLAATRFYFSGTLFGLPWEDFNPLLILLLLPALLLLWLLARLKFQKRKGPATLEVLGTQVGSVSTRLLPLQEQKTVIGGSRSAGLTVTAPQVKEQHATVVYDSQKKAYTVVASGEVMVNNQPVSKRRLEAGDVINVGGATIVFDDGESDS